MANEITCVEQILDVKRVRRNVGILEPEIVVNYIVVTDGVPGHNVYTLPWYNFNRKPVVGDLLERAGRMEYSKYSIIMRVHKQNTL